MSINTTVYSPDSGSVSLKRPCLLIEQTGSQELNKCCRLVDGIFHGNNTEAIMTLMKYSLDTTSPWITQYYDKNREDNGSQTLGDNRDMYKLWLGNSDNEILKLFSKTGGHNFPKEYG